MKHSNSILIISLLLCLGTVQAADTIKQIIITSVTGAPISRHAVLANIQLQQGSPFNEDTLSADIRRLYDTNQYFDIQAEVKKADAGSVTVHLKLEVNRRVRKIVLSGCDAIRPGALRSKLTQEENQILDEAKLQADLTALYKHYTNKGLTGTEIQQEVIERDNGREVDILYEIDEQPRAKVWRVQFEGNHSLRGELLAKKMQVHQLFRNSPVLLPFASMLKGFFPFFTSYYDEYALQTDLDLLRKTYWEYGFFDARVIRVEKRFGTTTGTIGYRRRPALFLRIHLAEGSQYRVKEVQFEGAKRFSAEELRSGLRLRPGRPYRGRNQTYDVTRLERKYHRLGYYDVRVNPELQSDPDSHQVIVVFQIREGKPSRIRNINISNNTETQDKVIRRELSIHSGDLSDRTKIERSKSRLKNLGYFRSVDIIATNTSDEGRKDLDVQVEEDDTGQFAVSAGFSDVDKVVGRVEFGQSNFDLFGWGRGFKGAGQRFKMNALVGGDQYSFGLNFTEPWLYDRRLRMDFALWHRETSNNRDYDQANTGGTIKFTRKLPWRYWRQSMGYRLERVRIDDFSTTFSPSFIAAEEFAGHVSTVLLGFSRDSRDSYIFPSAGSLLELDLGYQAEEIGSYTEAYRLLLAGDLYIPLFVDTDLLLPFSYSPVLKMSSSIGHVNRLDGDEIRIFDRFFAGGSSSIRGFDTREVGPVDAFNLEPVGGQSIFLASVELLQPLVENQIYAALFADAGNVWAETWGWELDKLNVGVGAGFRLRLPVGNISIDYGYPLNREQDHLDDGGRIHFSLGYRF